ncbi:ferredoxin-type protein NapF [Pelagibaculum spongiae]|uniref:Ferredoxin-type protein NapF n=2 Tax=Pelagibaculum spongiae TaxID=2080658 RepID=A0A2V1GXI9_9GAMM|nr:ferredoxin-type protein NapF [Pelagibaculum spongiae]
MSLNRRGFMTGRFREATIRPPWATDKFTDQCTRCGDCLKACPEKILIPGSGGFPEVNFSSGECTFCEACVDVCQEAALVKQPEQKPWLHYAKIGEDCLPRRGVICRSCSECCESAAIQFSWAESGVALPQLDPSLCNGCGACVSACPVNVITISSQGVEHE